MSVCNTIARLPHSLYMVIHEDATFRQKHVVSSPHAAKDLE